MELAKTGSRSLAGLLIVISFAFALRFGGAAARQLATPFDVLYETASRAIVDVITAGRNPYSPSVYAEPPFVLTVYTPLYHYLVAALPQHETNVFYTGRVVSLIATLLTAMLIPIASGRRHWGVGIVAAGLFLALWPVSQWGTYFKNDTTALAFSALGITAVHLSRGRAWLLVLAALCCVLAVACKQSSIAAGAAGALFLLSSDRRAFAIFAASGAVLGGGFLIFAMVHWGPGFWFSTVTANGQGITLTHALWVLRFTGPKSLLLIVPCIAAGLALVQWRRTGVETAKSAPYLLYAATSCLVCAATIGKEGSGANYLIESWLALWMWIAFALREAGEGFLERPIALAASGVLALACIGDLASARELDYSWDDASSYAKRARFYAQLREEVEALGFEHPSVLTFFFNDGTPDLRISGQSKTYMITNRVNLNDAWLYRVLWEAGVLDIKPLVAAIESQAFDLIIAPKWVPRIQARGALVPVYRTLMSPVASRYRLAAAGEAHVYYVRRD